MGTVLNAGVGGDTVADELIGGEKYQFVKAVDGTAGSTNKQIIDTAGRQYVLSRPDLALITATPTISTSIYAAGDVVGAALTFASAAAAVGRGGVIVGATLVDKARQHAALELWLFTVSPTLVNADNGVFDITDANLLTALPVGVVDFPAASYSDTASNSVSVGAVQGGTPMLPYVANTTTSIFGALVTRGTPTYASTGDLVVYLTVNRY